MGSSGLGRESLKRTWGTSERLSWKSRLLLLGMRITGALRGAMARFSAEATRQTFSMGGIGDTIKPGVKGALKET